MSKEPQRKQKFNRDSELRIRNFDPKLKAELQEIMKLTRKPFESYAVAYLISSYRNDQSLLKQYSQRNSELHSRLSKLVERENHVKQLLQSFLTQTVRFNTMTMTEIKKLLKQFSKSGTVRATGGQPGKVANSKSVPKKGGRK